MDLKDIIFAKPYLYQDCKVLWSFRKSLSALISLPLSFSPSVDIFSISHIFVIVEDISFLFIVDGLDSQLVLDSIIGLEARVRLCHTCAFTISQRSVVGWFSWLNNDCFGIWICFLFFFGWPFHVVLVTLPHSFSFFRVE